MPYSFRTHLRKGLLHYIGVTKSGFVVVMENAPVGQRQVGHEMMGADDLADWKIGDRRVHMRNEMQPPGPSQEPLTTMSVKL